MFLALGSTNSARKAQATSDDAYTRITQNRLLIIKTPKP